jgi:hypothetical protein
VAHTRAQLRAEQRAKWTEFAGHGFKCVIEARSL